MKPIFRNRRHWRRGLVVASLAVFVLTSLPVAASAQYNWDYATGYSSNLRYFAMKKVMRGVAGKKGSAGSAGTATKRRKSPTREETTTFTPMGDRNFRLWQRAVEITKNVDWNTDSPSEAYNRRHQAIEQLKSQMAASLDAFAGQARAEGKKPYDVAYGLGRSIAINYAVATGTTLGRSEQAGLIAQSRSHLLADPEFRKMGDEGRQRIYESAVVPAMMAKGAQDRELARKNLIALVGAPPEQLRIGAKGIVR